MTDIEIDNRKIVVLPIRAITDPSITDGALRILALICSYCDKNNTTFVSQKTLADDFKVSRQAITNQMAKLRAFGYIEIVKKSYKGKNTNTIKVLFVAPIHVEQAIKSDVQNNVLDVDIDGQLRIQNMMHNVFNIRPTTFKQMPKSGQSPTVQRMKAEIKKAQQIRQDCDPKPL